MPGTVREERRREHDLAEAARREVGAERGEPLVERGERVVGDERELEEAVAHGVARDVAGGVVEQRAGA